MNAAEFQSLQFSYDVEHDVLTVEGINYAGFMFRGIGLRTPIGAWIQICARGDGVVTLRSTATPAKFCPECGIGSADGVIRHARDCFFKFPAAPMEQSG